VVTILVKNVIDSIMKNLRLPFCFISFAAFAFAVFISSCSSPKQVFYFQSAPATPKVAGKAQNPQPVYTASTDATPVAVNPSVSGEIKTVAITKKELRKLLKQQVRLLQDTVPGKSRKVTVTGDKQKLKELKSEAKDFKNSVKVESSEDKVVINYREPVTDLSDTAKILLAVGALIVLVLLFSLPVIGPLLAAILAVAVVVAVLALILGYVEIHSN
jgi:hypothetical protein